MSNPLASDPINSEAMPGEISGGTSSPSWNENIQSGEISSDAVTKTSRKSLIPVVAGTVLLLGVGAVTFQYLKPSGASAVTNETQNSAQPQGKIKSIARINDQIITYDEVAQECFNRVGEEVLDNIINRTIIQQEVKKRGIVITEADINQEVARIAQKFNLPVDTWYQMLQAERNLTPVQYQRDIIWPKIALQKIAGSDVKITDQDMQKAFIRDYGPRVRCRMIMCDKIARANEVWEKVKTNPGDFDRHARDYSIEPNSRAIGGVIPPIARFTGNSKIEEVAFRMKPGEISGLIEAGVGQYVILKCEDITEPVVTDIKEVQKVLYENLLEEKTQERVAKIFEDLRKSTRVDNYLTNQSTGGVSPAVGQNQQNPAVVQPTSGTRPNR